MFDTSLLPCYIGHMNCLEEHFKNVVKSKGPTYVLVSDYVLAQLRYYTFQEPIDYPTYSSWGTATCLARSVCTWESGVVTKDRLGWFAQSQPLQPATNSFATVYIGDLPASPSEQAIWRGATWNPTNLSFPKCECGSHSVGSNKHSSYCPVKEA